jgi:hypothetical protein
MVMFVTTLPIVELASPAMAGDLLILIALLAAIAFVMRRRAGLVCAALTTLAGLAAYVLDQRLYLPLAILLVGVLSRPPDQPRVNRGWAEVGGAFALAGCGFVLYERGRTLSQGAPATPFGNAERLVAVDQAMRLPSEASVRHLFVVHGWLVSAFSFIYSSFFLFTVIAVCAWLLLTNLPLARLYRGARIWSAPPAGERRGWLLGAVPALAIALVVIASGNRSWLGGVAGAAICLTPLVLTRNPTVATRWLEQVWRAMVEVLQQRRAVRNAMLALSCLLGCLLIGQLVAPGFTEYWGYHVAQLIFYISVALVGESMFRRAGGLFGAPTLAFIVAAATFDVFGTTQDFYSTLVVYDKIVHFLGTATFTAVVLDILLACSARRGRTGAPGRLILLGVILGITAGIGWELYEYIGDTVFDSGRVQSRLDTGYDLLFDAFGALLMGTIASLRIWPIAWRAALPERRLAEAHSLIEAGSRDVHAD